MIWVQSKNLTVDTRRTMPNKIPYTFHDFALGIAVEILLHRGAAERQKIETERPTLRCCVGMCEWSAQGNAPINLNLNYPGGIFA